MWWFTFLNNEFKRGRTLMKLKLMTKVLALGMTALCGTQAMAQGSQDAGSQAARRAPGAYAGASFGSPLAFGADWGRAGIGAYVETQPDNSSEDLDGSMGLVFGLGNATKYIGFETAIGISSLTGASGDDFGEAGSVGFKLHTSLPGAAAFAVGVVGTGRWGNAQAVNKASVYAVGTKVLSVGGDNNRKALVLNLGLGDVQFNRPNKSGAGLFGSVGFYFTRQLSVIADHTGRFTNLAVSAAPFSALPLSVTLGLKNVTQQYNGDMEVALSVGYGLSF